VQYYLLFVDCGKFLEKMFCSFLIPRVLLSLTIIITYYILLLGYQFLKYGVCNAV